MCCSVNGSVVCCVLDSVFELFGETIRNMFGCGCYFLLNVMEVFSVGVGLCWIDRVWAFKEFACCVCDPSEHLNTSI